MGDLNPIGALSFRIAALIICITCIFYTAVIKKETKKRLRSRLFLVALIITCYDCITGIVNTLVLDSSLSLDTKYLVVYFNKLTYYGTHFAFVPVFALYIILVCDVFHRYRSKLSLALFFGPCLLLELAVITNPITGFIISNGIENNLKRGGGVYLAYVFSAVYLGFCFYLLGRYWNTMNHLQKIAMFYFLGLAVTGVIVQMIFPEIICEMLAESLGLMGVMIMVEKDDYRLDYKTQAYNRSALIHDLKGALNVEKKFHVICVRIINADLYRRLMGYEGYDVILTNVADFLKSLDYRFDVYRTTGGNFYMLCEDMCGFDVDKVIEKIVNRFEESFETEYGATNVKAKIICVKCPDEFSDAYDILRLSECNIDEEDKIVFKGKDIEFLLRNIDVEKAIIRGIAGDAFMVLYHPIYDKKTLGVVSAEALLRLNDSVMGKIRFSEFKAVAEDAGVASELEFRMIDSVCQFINSGVKKSDMDIKVFVIHIMSVQVLKQELVDKVRACVKKYEIDTGMLRFSVSDTIATQAQDVLGYIIDEFNKIGIRFILFNMDSGFLRLDVTTIDKFDGINVDVKRHFESEDATHEEAILRDKVNMLSQLGKRVVLSGIDSKELYDRVKDVKADFIIGDYLSPGVTKNELQNKFWNKEVFNEKST
jgi:EAL domain-containing protein (putative c-di-GMP-specific phosphodiesterase class I)/GGDEF domain-containing protein